MSDLKTGILNISVDEYHKINAVSRTILEVLHNGSPAHVYEYMKNKPEPTPAMELGSAIHIACLEPELYAQHVVVVKSRSQSAKLEHRGKILILEREAEIVEGIKKSLQTATVEFNGKEIAVTEILKLGGIEQTMVWRDPETGVLCKSKPDITFEESIIDWKTTSSMKDFARNAYNLGYHRQAAFYVCGYSHVSSVFPRDFHFLVVEKEAPFGIKLFKCSKEFINRGTADNQQNLKILAKCLNTGVWPSYSPDVEILDLPRWAVNP